MKNENVRFSSCKIQITRGDYVSTSDTVFWYIGVQISWLKNATMFLSTEAPSQLVPVNLVTRPALGPRPGTNDRPGPNELPDDDDSIVVEAEVTEPAHITTTSTSSKITSA